MIFYVDCKVVGLIGFQDNDIGMDFRDKCPEDFADFVFFGVELEAGWHFGLYGS